MSRPCQRVRLESELKLDICRLARHGFLHAGAAIGPVIITWTNSYTRAEVASGIITANMTRTDVGWFRIQPVNSTSRFSWSLTRDISAAANGTSSAHI